MTDKTDRLIKALSNYGCKGSCMDYFDEIIDLLEDHPLEIDFDRGGHGYVKNSILNLIDDWMRYSRYPNVSSEFLDLACIALKEQLDESKKEIGELKKEKEDLKSLLEMTDKRWANHD